MAWRAVRNTLIFLFMIMLVICISPALVRAKDGLGGGLGATPVVSGSENVDSILNKATSGSGISLQSAIQSAMDTNPDFLSKKHAYSSSHEAYLKSFGALLPQVNAVTRGGIRSFRMIRPAPSSRTSRVRLGSMICEWSCPS